MDVWETAKANDPHLPDDLKVHKPYIDHVTYDSPFASQARMVRVTEVIVTTQNAALSARLGAR